MLLDSDAAGGRWARLDRVGGAVEPLALSYAEHVAETNGAESFSRESLHLDEAGTVYLAFTRNDTHRLRRSVDLASTWVELGAPLPAAPRMPTTWVDLRIAGSTVLAASTGNWAPTAFHFALQRVTPREARTWVDPVAAPYEPRFGDARTRAMLAELSADGRCVATWRVTGPPADANDHEQMGEAELVVLGDGGREHPGATLPHASELAFSR